MPIRPGLGTRVVLGWDHYPDGVIMSPLNWPGAKGDVGSPLGGVSQEKVTNVQHRFFRLVFLTKTHPNSIKTIQGLNVQGGNAIKSMFYPGFVEQTNVEV